MSWVIKMEIEVNRTYEVCIGENNFNLSDDEVKELFDRLKCLIDHTTPTNSLFVDKPVGTRDIFVPPIKPTTSVWGGLVAIGGYSVPNVVFRYQNEK